MKVLKAKSKGDRWARQEERKGQIGVITWQEPGGDGREETQPELLWKPYKKLMNREMKRWIMN